MEMQKTICSLNAQIEELNNAINEFRIIHNLSDSDIRVLIKRAENISKISHKLEEGPPSLDMFNTI